MHSYKTLAAAFGLFAASDAHMFLALPQPFTTPQLSNSPLNADGSNFPCQSNGGAFSGAATSMALGSSQPLTFNGQSVHGGGSCQVSITYDTNPTKNSVWKVIHSIEGGCPAKNLAGNIAPDNNAEAPDPDTYTFPIPTNIPTGKATLAWTWLNRIGNREFYMACAPIQLTGTSGAQANYEALPDMLVANINAGGGGSCATTENFDYKYPNPGPSVDRFNMTELIYPVGAGCGTPGSSGSSSGSGSTSAPSAAAPAPAVQSSAAPNPAPSPAPTQAGGVFITQAASAGGAPAATPVASSSVAPVPAPASPPASSSVAVAPAPVQSSPSSGSGGGSTPSSGSAAGAHAAGTACSNEGDWNCVGGTSFQRCASGMWSAIIQMAAGTSCTAGQSAVINIVSSSGKARRLAVRFRG